MNKNREGTWGLAMRAPATLTGNANSSTSDSSADGRGRCLDDRFAGPQQIVERERW